MDTPFVRLTAALKLPVPRIGTLPFFSSLLEANLTGKRVDTGTEETGRCS
jgi:hypothetical protein